MRLFLPINGVFVFVSIEIDDVVFKEVYPRKEMAHDSVAMLLWLEQQRAVLILGTIESLGPIKSSAHLKPIKQPAGLIRERAAHGPGRAYAFVKFVAPKEEAAQIEVEFRIAKKSRRIF